MDGRLDGAHEPRAHVDAAGPEAQRGREAPAVGEPTAGDEGHASEGLARATEEDKVGNVALADVAGALEAVDAEKIDAQADGALGVADAGALVQDGDAGLFELLDDGAGGVTRSLDNVDPLVDDGLGVGAVVRRDESRQKGDIDGKGTVGEGAAAADLVAQGSGRGENEGGDDAQAAGVGDGRGEVSGPDVHHATLDDGDANA